MIIFSELNWANNLPKQLNLRWGTKILCPLMMHPPTAWSISSSLIHKKILFSWHNGVKTILKSTLVMLSHEMFLPHCAENSRNSGKYEIVTLYITDDLLTMTRQPIYNFDACIIISLKPKLMQNVFFRHLVINKYKCVLWYRNSPLLLYS